MLNPRTAFELIVRLAAGCRRVPRGAFVPSTPRRTSERNTHRGRARPFGHRVRASNKTLGERLMYECAVSSRVTKFKYPPCLTIPPLPAETAALPAATPQIASPSATSLSRRPTPIRPAPARGLLPAPYWHLACRTGATSTSPHRWPAFRLRPCSSSAFDDTRAASSTLPDRLSRCPGPSKLGPAPEHFRFSRASGALPPAHARSRRRSPWVDRQLPPRQLHDPACLFLFSFPNLGFSASQIAAS